MICNKDRLQMAQKVETRTELEQQIDEKLVGKLGNRARKELTHNENEKQTIIRNFAKALLRDARVPDWKISSVVSKELVPQGYATHQYIAKCLDASMKDQRKVRSMKGRSRNGRSGTGKQGSQNSPDNKTFSIEKIPDSILGVELFPIILKFRKMKNLIGARLSHTEGEGDTLKVVNAVPVLK